MSNNLIPIKKCLKCKIEKEKSELNFKLNKKTNCLSSRCLVCLKKQSKKSSLKRRNRIRNLPYDWDKNKWELTKKAFDYRCVYCGITEEELKEKNQVLHQDHLYPVSKKGCPGSVLGNFVSSCLFCNLSKKSKSPLKWVRDKEKLKFILETLESLKEDCEPNKED